ncbi:MAG: hypothetical protein BRC40_15055 [Cyanobacteria bacterium QH_8_48_120]|jgi:GTPase involved in cell partitioning and DNA repair|nr:MAG: hypothetical protein BRC34_16390 [Cyanobacteria bacterium QH_1_48_107]PSO58742.1 MAG: hypothetical protein BRC35_05195 [Cyanobacteria bacterium QH_10_48_56]PSO60693.1 MAG: hypothetical protein BRC39_09460 [Cyanobacteria bacterium QH_7_48_89]PSO62621.1 MAG: hypothetical protein BRC36_09760 [Cyanobacteria bacterium QH_2_48_84]PSO65192.1 MAG: hypothetical protein BRC38_09595 [Cyanobacteria bacterium QH_6_48_35]PSO69227.1 MAG: hypothetical protein BRC42_12425 [Cyanobacteria bacterium QS_1_
MLPPIHLQRYQKLLTLLEQLQQSATAPNFEGTDLKKDFQKVQQFFQNQVMTLTSEELDPEVAARWQSLQTEIHRSLRLLQTDVMFLQASRQATTSQQRQARLCDRVEQLIGYVKALLEQT